MKALTHHQNAMLILWGFFAMLIKKKNAPVIFHPPISEVRMWLAKVSGVPCGQRDGKGTNLRFEWAKMEPRWTLIWVLS